MARNERQHGLRRELQGLRGRAAWPRKGCIKSHRLGGRDAYWRPR